MTQRGAVTGDGADTEQNAEVNRGEKGKTENEYEAG